MIEHIITGTVTHRFTLRVIAPDDDLADVICDAMQNGEYRLDDYIDYNIDEIDIESVPNTIEGAINE
jgi:poly-beta-hydroxyalkanoate depolymerase